jgi:hypothetical protein
MSSAAARPRRWRRSWIFDHSLAAAVISGTLVAVPTMIAMIRYQDSEWERAAADPLMPDED